MASRRLAVGGIAVGLGVPGNLLIAVVFGRRKEKNATDVAIISLALVDLFSCLSLATKAVVHPLHGPADWTCIVISMVAQTNLYSALFITLSLAVYRYVAVLHPFSRMVVARRAWLISAACVLLATVVQIPLIFTATSKKQDDTSISCVGGSDENKSKTDHGLGELVGPNAVVSTARIPPSSACDNKPAGVLATKSVAKQRRQADHKTTQMLMFITIIFFIGWLPTVALRLIPPDSKQGFARRVPLALTTINVLLQLKNFNHFINVFVYLIFNRKFRQGCVECLRCGQ
ncbi:somatostatin receptor type 4-like [Diadema setosum]|uniref:somatostatin receptor type 4-like n=1 Tax=Diadema setosum TaxID=31175 RepID=UPI003B3B44CF